MLRPLVPGALAMAACACASPSPSPSVLCGSWRGEDMRERWWLDGPDLRGEGLIYDDEGALRSSERLALVASRGGHIYVAQPGDAAPVEFAPIDPAAVRYEVEVPTGATAWVWANYDHDFPQEIHYVLLDDTLDATIAGPGEPPEVATVYTWTLTRAAACERGAGS